MTDGLELDDVLAAAVVLDGVANRTPVLTSRTLDERVGATVACKAENFQRGGAFKFRGAYNAVASLTPDERARGVCTVSSGNHAQALAIAARELGAPAVILMPTDAPSAKLDATRGYGAEVVLYDRYSVSQAEAGRRLREEQTDRCLTFVSSHDDPRISAGAGTAALELWDEAGPFDVLVAPIGGGGGMAGYATVAKTRNPACVVIGVEAAASGVNKRSLAEGRRVEIEIPRTIADGQQLTTPGRFPFSVMQQRVDDVVLVPDDEIVAAMVFLFDRMKVVTEPSGAIATAALLSDELRPVVGGRRVGVIITGGNVGAARFCELTGRIAA